jgi:hypothetical protein
MRPGPGRAVSAGSTVVRARQHAAGARRQTGADARTVAEPDARNPPGGGANREALGRSSGGLSPKIRLAADRRRRPVTRILTPGQCHDSPQFIALIDAIRIAREGAPAHQARPGHG